jgi:wyosine [tRNA(Phe)-imidazoG37] synthetase (radical SAM superfamily)
MPRVYTYGPFQSRRLGLSLGINVLSNYKLCTFNCIYCEIGITNAEFLVSPNYRIELPPSSQFRKELKSILMQIPHLNSLTFGYNGEPTLNENLLDFLRIASDVREEISWIGEKPKLTLFTNSTTLHFNDVRERVKQFEVVLAKLDVTTDEDLKRINRASGTSPDMATIINSLSKLKQEMPENNELVIQSLLFSSYKEDFIPNDTPSNIKNLAHAIKQIKPNKVQIYSIARIPAEYFVYAIDEERKKEITEKIEEIVQDSSIEINYY